MRAAQKHGQQIDKKLKNNEVCKRSEKRQIRKLINGMPELYQEL